MHSRRQEPNSKYERQDSRKQSLSKGGSKPVHPVLFQRHSSWVCPYFPVSSTMVRFWDLFPQVPATSSISSDTLHIQNPIQVRILSWLHSVLRLTSLPLCDASWTILLLWLFFCFIKKNGTIWKRKKIGELCDKKSRKFRFIKFYYEPTYVLVPYFPELVLDNESVSAYVSNFQ